VKLIKGVTIYSLIDVAMDVGISKLHSMQFRYVTQFCTFNPSNPSFPLVYQSAVERNT
jgi:hypothetical protein